MSTEKDLFPDPEADKAKEKDTKAEFEIEVEGDEKPEAGKKAKKKAELDIEIVDDTPEKDRGKKRAAPPEELTDEELAAYGDKVQARIKKFDRAYHDERRAKEEALRERDALEKAARALLEERDALKGTLAKNQTTLVDQAKSGVNAELDLARKEYKEAYETGGPDKVLAAQGKLTAAKIKADRVNNFKLPPLQERKAPVKDDPPARRPDPKVEAWVKRNPWFHTDDEMTGYALGLHNKLVNSGVDPNSDEYYTKLDSRIRQVFPDRFNDEDEDDDSPPQRKKAATVAPASRSTAPKKIRLTKSQVAVANRLGISLEDYARHMVALENEARTN